MEFRLLGPLEVIGADEQPVRLDGKKARLLLATLALHANQVVTVDRLIDALWADEPPTTARQTIQYFVHKLRKALGGPTGDGKDVLETHTAGYLLRVAPGALDLDRFEAGLRQARQARASGDPGAVVEALTAALAEWRGPALADFASEAFAQPAIGRLEEQRLAAVEELAEERLALGDHAALVSELEALSRSQPLRERVHRLLMLALYRSGRQAEALAVYRRFRDRLVEELGLEPGAELRRLEARILAQDPALASSASPASDVGPAPVRPGVATPPPAGSSGPGPAVPAGNTAGRPTASATSQPAGSVAVPTEEQREERWEERRMITALVAGIGLPAAATRDPEDALAHRGRAAERLLEVISRYGGVVVTVFGGTILAVFGVPTAREDDPERAVRAALAICQDPANGTTIRIGVETGEAIIAPRLGWGGTGGGGQVAVAGGVTGAVLDVAAQLQTVAPPGGMLVGQAAYRATVRRIDYELAGTAWRPVGPRSRIGMVVDEADPSRRPPLIERRNQLALLAGLLGRARRERVPQLVTVVGVPGIGKTRLVAELGRQAEADPELIAWRQGRSVPYGQPADGDGGEGGVAFWALVEIVRAHTGIAETDSAQAAGAKLEAAVADVLPDPAEAEQVTAQLRRLLQLSPTGEPAGEPAPEQRQAAFAGWARFLEAVAAERPLALVFEDLHWADEALLAFVDQLVDRAGPVPLLVVCTGRPELLSRRPGWGGGKPNMITVTLDPLSPAGAEALLDGLLAADGIDLDEPARRAVLTKAGGNPLFLEEYVRVLRGRSRGRGLDGLGGGGELPIPETVQQVITARIDQLDEADRRLLGEAAVVGDPVTVAPLTALTTLDGGTVGPALARLERHGLLSRVRAATPGGQPTYAFRHALIRDVAYNQLLRADRAGKHRRVAAWLESLPAEGAADRAELLANHYEQALTLTLTGTEGHDLRLASRARLAFRAAGDRASALNAHTAAARRYAAALDLCPPDDPDRPDLLFRLGLARVYGEHAGEAELLAAKDAYVAAGDEARVAEVDLFLGQAAGLRGDADAMAAHLQHARGGGLGPTQGSLQGSAEGDLYTAIELVIADRHEEAAAIAAVAGTRATALGQLGIAGAALGVAGQARIDAGDPGGAKQLRQAIATMDAHGHRTVGLARFALVWALWWLGDLAAAQAALDEHRPAVKGTATAEWMEAIQAGIDCTAGRWEAATDRLDQILTGHDPTSLDYVAPFCLLERARIRSGRGDHNGALADVDAATPLAVSQPGSRQAQLALALRGRVLADMGERHAAAGCLAQLLQEQRRDPKAARVTREQAELVVEFGEPADTLPDGLVPSRWNEAAAALARRDFAEAVRRYEAVGAAVDAAAARVWLARQLRAEQPAAAHAALDRAVEIFEAAGADAFLLHAKALGAELR